MVTRVVVTMTEEKRVQLVIEPAQPGEPPLTVTVKEDDSRSSGASAHNRSRDVFSKKQAPTEQACSLLLYLAAGGGGEERDLPLEDIRKLRGWKRIGTEGSIAAALNRIIRDDSSVLTRKNQRAWIRQGVEVAIDEAHRDAILGWAGISASEKRAPEMAPSPSPVQGAPAPAMPKGPKGGQLGYIVFIKLCGISDQPGNEIAHAFDALFQAAEDAIARAGIDGCRVLSAHGGGFVVVPKSVTVALDIAQQIGRACMDHGVTTAIGVTRGTVFDTRDAVELNVAGTAINKAARIAYHKHAERRIGVEQAAVKEACTAHGKYRDVLATLEWIEVKETKIEMAWAKGAEWVQRVATSCSTCTGDGYNAQDAYAIVYDVVGYSKRSDEEQIDIGHKLSSVVAKAARDAGAELGHDEWVWYAPTGDGGALVFGADHGEASFTFATALAKHADATIPLRIGIDTGQAFVRGKKRLPVGPVVFRADALSSAGKVAPLCAGDAYWNETLSDVDRKSWAVVKAAPEIQAVHVSPAPRAPDPPKGPTTRTRGTRGPDPEPMHAADAPTDEELGRERQALLDYVRRTLTGRPSLRADVVTSLPIDAVPGVTLDTDTVARFYIAPRRTIFDIVEHLDRLDGELDEQGSREDDRTALMKIACRAIPFAADFQAEIALWRQELVKGVVLVLPFKTLTYAEAILARIHDRPAQHVVDNKGVGTSPAAISASDALHSLARTSVTGASAVESIVKHLATTLLTTERSRPLIEIDDPRIRLPASRWPDKQWDELVKQVDQRLLFHMTGARDRRLPRVLHIDAPDVVAILEQDEILDALRAALPRLDFLRLSDTERGEESVVAYLIGAYLSKHSSRKAT